MPDEIDLAQSVKDAEDRRQANQRIQLETQKSQRSELVGDLLLDVKTVVNDGSLEHETRVARLRAASACISGQGVAPASAGSAPFDYNSLSEDQQKLISLVVAEPRRFLVEPSGAVKDKQYTKLNKDYQAEQAAVLATGGDADDDSSATPPAAKKAASSAPAKKATPAAPAPAEATQPPPEPAPVAPVSPPSAWERIKQAAKNAQQ